MDNMFLRLSSPATCFRCFAGSGDRRIGPRGRLHENRGLRRRSIRVHRPQVGTFLSTPFFCGSRVHFVYVVGWCTPCVLVFVVQRRFGFDVCSLHKILMDVHNREVRYDM